MTSRRRLGLALFAVAFGTNVSTPLLLAYQTRLDLSAWTVTALFAIYPIGLFPALIWGGPASDAHGRKRLSVAALAASAIASYLFVAGGDSLMVLFMARFLLGAVSGVAFVVMTAWMQELSLPEERAWSARLVGLLMYAGFGLGPLASGILAQWGPRPLVTPFLVHIALVLVALAIAWGVPETVTPDPTRSARPDLGLTADTRRPFWRLVAPTALAVFGFAALSFSLFPVLLRPVMAEVAVLVAGIVAALTSLSIFAMQGAAVRLGPERGGWVAYVIGTAGCGLGAVAFMTGWWPLIFPAAIAMGSASALAVTSGLWLVDDLAEPDRRGAMTGAFYGVAYAGMTTPVLIASLAGTEGYSAVLIGLTIVAGLGAYLLRRASIKTQ